MEQKFDKQPKLTRRSFLKTMAAASAALSLPDFLDRFPNNYMDGDSLDDWAAFMNKYQDRVLIGTDKVGHWATYPAEVVKYYKLLDKLSPDVVRKVCRDNVLKLVKRHY